MRSIFVLQYNGIGDTIVNAPLINSMLDSPEVSYIYLSRNDMWDFLKNRIDHNNKLHLLPQKFRNLDYMKDVDMFLKEKKITDIISYRRDITKDPHFFKRYESVFKSNRIRYYCFEHQFTYQECSSLHFYELGCRLTEAVGRFKPPKTMHGWLTHYFPKQTKKEKKLVVLYLGASVENKRLPVKVWVSIIQNLNQNNIPFLILHSHTQEEQSYEKAVINSLASKIQVCGITLDGFEKIILFLQQCTGLISCDTYIIHLAVSLDIPVFGIYVSTDSKIYGPQNCTGTIYQNPGYDTCTFKNDWGNCNGWKVCEELPCLYDLQELEILKKLNNC